MWRIASSERQRSMAAPRTCATDWRNSVSSREKARGSHTWPSIDPYARLGPGIGTPIPPTTRASIRRAGGEKRCSRPKSSTITGLSDWRTNPGNVAVPADTASVPTWSASAPCAAVSARSPE